MTFRLSWPRVELFRNLSHDSVIARKSYPTPRNIECVMLCPFACQLDNETVAGKLMNKMFQLITTLEEAQGGGGGAQLDEESLQKN